MKSTFTAVAVVALMLTGCTSAATPTSLPPATVTVTATPTPSAPAVGLKASCTEASDIIKKLSDVPDADEYASAAETMYGVVQRGDQDSKEVFLPVETALKELSTATPGMEYLNADKHLLASLNSANTRCLAVGSKAFDSPCGASPLAV